jgi:ankyrin repeat protein
MRESDDPLMKEFAAFVAAVAKEDIKQINDFLVSNQNYIQNEEFQALITDVLLHSINTQNLPMMDLFLNFITFHQENIENQPFQALLNEALLFSVENRNCQMAKLCLAYGANAHIEFQNHGETFTLLMQAVINQDLPMCQLLIDHDSEVNVSNNYQRTPLRFAVDNNNAEITELLLNHGAEVDVIYRDGNTALMKAVNNNNPKIFELLIAHNADVNIQNGHRNALRNAVIDNKLPIAEILFKHKANITYEKGSTPLLTIAAQKGYKKMVELLLKHGADMNRGDKGEEIDIADASSGGVVLPSPTSTKRPGSANTNSSTNLKKQKQV